MGWFWASSSPTALFASLPTQAKWELHLRHYLLSVCAWNHGTSAPAAQVALALRGDHSCSKVFQLQCGCCSRLAVFSKVASATAQRLLDHGGLQQQQQHMFLSCSTVHGYRSVMMAAA